MISNVQLREWQNEAAARAAAEKQTPITLYSHDTAESDVRSAPFLGEYQPAGWRHVDPEIDQWLWDVSRRADDDGDLFIDISGFGQPGEPALSREEWAGEVHTILAEAEQLDLTIGVALYEVGQFQAHLRFYVQDKDAEEFVPSDADPANLCPSCEEHLLDDEGGCECGYNRCAHCWHIEADCDCDRCPVCNEKLAELCGCAWVQAQDHGSLWLFALRTDDVKAWWSKNVEEGRRWFDHYVVEHRYAIDIVRALRDEFGEDTVEVL